MNAQYLLLCVISGLYVSQTWHLLLTPPSLWRKRKNLSKEQHAILYFFRAMAIIVSLSAAYSLGALLERGTDEQVLASDYTLLITGMGVVPCLLGSWMLLVQRERETPKYDGRSLIAIGLFTLVMNFLIS
jgi:hypothetical protein